MTKQKVWKITKTNERESIVRKLMELLGIKQFSKAMDIIFYLADERLKKKDEVRRRIQSEIQTFRFIPSDFTWGKR